MFCIWIRISNGKFAFLRAWGVGVAFVWFSKVWRFFRVILFLASHFYFGGAIIKMFVVLCFLLGVALSGTSCFAEGEFFFSSFFWPKNTMKIVFAVCLLYSRSIFVPFKPPSHFKKYVIILEIHGAKVRLKYTSGWMPTHFWRDLFTNFDSIES